MFTHFETIELNYLGEPKRKNLKIANKISLIKIILHTQVHNKIILK